MSKPVRIVVEVIAAVALAAASYWLLGLLLRGLVMWLSTDSTIGNIAAASLVYVSPLLFGFPLVIVLAIGFYVLIWRIGRRDATRADRPSS